MRPVHLATYHPRILRIRIDQGVDLDTLDLQGRTPLGVDIDASFDDAGTVLLAAAAINNRDIIEFLLSRGAKIDIPDSYHRTPLLDAARGGRDKIVGILLKHGTNVEAKQHSSVTPLIAASMYPSYPSSVELLLKHGADVGHAMDDGWMALHYAARHGNDKLVRVLLEYGAEVDAEDTSSMTHLIMAAIGSSEATVDVLLEHGADPARYDINGDTALDNAIQYSTDDMILHLLGKDVLTVLDPGVMNNNSDCPNIKRNALHKAIFAKESAKVETILNGICDQDLDTLLHNALHTTSLRLSHGVAKVMIGSVEVYGFLHGDNGLVWAKRYKEEKLGWLYRYSGTLDCGTLSISGTWGTNAQLWHGGFVLLCSAAQ
ncbi:ankyrin repeat-containing domain protein [Aspergillus cavernicola]|uniref:protein S-acyltransferase n=1 Tax=Aspergillus cavernicola TaxID=176166 RepID=A0ABR4IRX4_9EURO